MPYEVKTLTEVAREYNVHLSTMIRWIKPIKEELYVSNRKLLLPWQVKMIKKFLGSPSKNKKKSSS